MTRDTITTTKIVLICLLSVFLFAFSWLSTHFFEFAAKVANASLVLSLLVWICLLPLWIRNRKTALRSFLVFLLPAMVVILVSLRWYLYGF